MNERPDPAAMLCRNCVLADLKADTQVAVLDALAGPLSRATGIPADLVSDALQARERLGATAFGGGTAVPHARFPELEGCVGAFAVLAEPVDFGAADGEPVDLVFALLSPAKDGADHLAALAAVGRLFRDQARLRKLRGAQGGAAIHALLLTDGWRDAA